MTTTSLDHVPFKALGGQPAFDPDDLAEFVEQRRVAVLAYVRSDGRPNQAPIWYTHRDGAFHMSTTTNGPKHRAVKRNPRISLTIQDERRPTEPSSSTAPPRCDRSSTGPTIRPTGWPPATSVGSPRPPTTG